MERGNRRVARGQRVGPGFCILRRMAPRPISPSASRANAPMPAHPIGEISPPAGATPVCVIPVGCASTIHAGTNNAMLMPAIASARATVTKKCNFCDQQAEQKSYFLRHPLREATVTVASHQSRYTTLVYSLQSSEHWALWPRKSAPTERCFLHTSLQEICKFVNSRQPYILLPSSSPILLRGMCNLAPFCKRRSDPARSHASR